MRAAASSTIRSLSFDAYLEFIEDDFLGGTRLDPLTDGRPDSRPTVRENVKILGNLVRDFDFSQKPRPPLLLSPHPRPTPIAALPWLKGLLLAGWSRHPAAHTAAHA